MPASGQALHSTNDCFTSFPMTAMGGRFNRSMQHTNHRIGGRSVANETATKDLLL